MTYFDHSPHSERYFLYLSTLHIADALKCLRNAKRKISTTAPEKVSSYSEAIDTLENLGHLIEKGFTNG